MCDQTIPYTPGTWVWAKVLNRIWWPGKIVDQDSIPDELSYFRKQKKNAKTAVFFEREKSYEIITNLDKVFLYSCAKKMEFVEKGYLLYARQQKNGTVIAGIDMKNFIEDVQNVEKNIGGNTNIFDQFIKKKESEEIEKISHGINIKELFITEKERKKRERDERRSLSSSSPVFKPKQISKNTTPVLSTRKNIHKMPVVPQGFHCPYCNNFSTNRFNNLKWHMNAHKNENKDLKNGETSKDKKATVTKKSPKSKMSASCSTSSISSTPKKRKNTKTKNSDSKKIKLQDELLKDWDDGEDLEENIIQVKDEYHNDSDLDKDSDQNEVTKVDSLDSESTSKVKETTPTRIFDFDENEDNELHESFQSHSSSGISNDNSNLPKKSRSAVEVESVVQCGNNCETTSTQNDVHKEISNVKNNLEDVDTQKENITTDNKDSSNDKDNCSNIDNIQLENTETEDKADAELGHNIENFLSSLPKPDWVKINWEKLNTKDVHDKANSFSAELKMPTHHENTQSEILKEIPRAAEQEVCSDDGLVGEVPSNKTNTETWRSEDCSKRIYCVDLSEMLKPKSPFPINSTIENDEITGKEIFFTEAAPHNCDDINGELEHSGPITVYFPKIPPVHTNEELTSSETYHKIMEMADAGGQIFFEMKSSKLYYESA